MAASWATPFAEVIGTTTIRHFSTTVWLIQSTRLSSLAVLAVGVALVAAAWLARWPDATPLAAVLAFTATVVALWLAASASGSFNSSPVENPVEGRLLEPGFDAVYEHFRSEVIYAHARPLVGFWLLLVPAVVLLPWTAFRLAHAVIQQRVVAILVSVVFSSVAFFLALSWFYLTKLG